MNSEQMKAWLERAMVLRQQLAQLEADIVKILHKFPAPKENLKPGKRRRRSKRRRR